MATPCAGERDRAIVRGEARIDAGDVALACTIAKGADGTRKTYTLNGRDVRYSGFLGKLRVVTFVPADLQSRRRRAEPAPGASSTSRCRRPSRATIVSWRAIARRCSRRTRCCAARSSPTRSCSRSTIAALVENGTDDRARARERFVARACRGRTYCPRAGSATVAKRSRWLTTRTCLSRAPPRMRSPQRSTHSPARRSGTPSAQRRAAIAGPHRDDLTLTLDGRSLAAYGSQGQQRTAVLALKVAEYAVVCATRRAKRRCSCSTTFFRSSTKNARRRSWRASASTSRPSSRPRTCRRACRRALAFRRSAGASVPASAASC